MMAVVNLHLCRKRQTTHYTAYVSQRTRWGARELFLCLDSKKSDH